MEQPIVIDKRAFIAHVNETRKREVMTRHIVTSYYQMIDGSQKLILVHEDGSEEIFKGLRAA